MASTDQRHAAPLSPTVARIRPSPMGAAVIGLGVASAIYVLYFLAYPIRHLALPVGFDPAWYVWRAEHLTALGVGNGQLAARPGYPVLSAILGSLTGLSQLKTTVVLSLVVVALLALAVGAFAAEGLDRVGWRWALIVATTGVVLGPTHLLGENLSNATNIALEIGALAALLGFVAGRRGMAAAAALLVASGLAHWDFVALFAVVLVAAFLMALSSSLRERREGVPAIRTEAGSLAFLGAWTGGVLLLIVGAVLRAPFRTMEIGNDEVLFRRKFRTDVARLAVPGVASLVGPWTLVRSQPSSGPVGPIAPASEERRRRFAVRLLRAWTYVMAAGMVLGLVTVVVPPARFLAHLVALPGAVTLGLVIATLAMRARKRRARQGGGRGSRLLPVAVALTALAALAVPGMLRWYRYPVLMEPAALQQVRTADGYLATLAPHRPVVFLVDYMGRPGSLSAVMKERTIRVGLSPDRQLDAHVFVGTLADLLRGRRTEAPDDRAERFTRRYWEDVRPLLAARAPIVVLRSMAGSEYRRAAAGGARVVAPGVAVLRGPASGVRIQPSPPPWEIPSLVAGLAYGPAFLVLLWVAGAGWTMALLGRPRRAETSAALAPLVGCAALILVGLGAAELGVRLATAGAVSVFLAVSVSGVVAAFVTERRTTRGPASSLPTGSSSTRPFA